MTTNEIRIIPKFNGSTNSSASPLSIIAPIINMMSTTPLIKVKLGRLYDHRRDIHHPKFNFGTQNLMDRLIRLRRPYQ